ncbi:MAG: hypothetical protein K0R18_163 [Bacillales bacterium]|jgi:hypothetical protein|nr:hypothetical protein [Bacillales bacterium]
MDRKIVLEAVYSYVNEFANIDYDGFETVGEKAEKKVIFNDVEDLVEFCIKNKLELSVLPNGTMVVVTDPENPEDASILGPVAAQIN